MPALLAAYVALTAVVLAAACDGDAPSPPPDPTNPAFPPPPDGEGLQLSLLGEVAAGGEDAQCRYLVLPDREIDVTRLEHLAGAGIHHVLLYPTGLTPAEIADQQAPFACAEGGALGQTGLLYASSEVGAELAYPADTGLRLPPSSVVLLEAHGLNPTPAPLALEARVNLWFAAEPIAIEAGTLFFYDWAIYLDPAPATAVARMRCEIPAEITLLGSSSHTHRRGTEVVAELEAPDGAVRPLHRTAGGALPPPTVHLPPVTVAAGSTIDVRCGFRNDLDQPVIEGPSAEHDEMCIYGAIYYPRLPRAAELCTASGSGPVFAGTASCGDTVECMLDAGVADPVGGQACIARTCEASSTALDDFLGCVETFGCWGDQACVAAKCLAEWNVCDAAGCGADG